MCPACDNFCDYWKLSDICYYNKAMYLFDNPSTVFFSAFMSLVSISLAQVSVYKTRHEFDMNFFGNVCYTLSTFLATFVKLTIHTICYTTVLIASIDPTRSDVQFSLFASQLLVFVFQLQIMFIVDWAMVKEGGSGYCLNVNSAYIWPTSANLSIERLRLRELKEDTSQLYLVRLFTRIYTTLCKALPKIFNDLTALQKFFLWIPASIILPTFTPARLGRFPSEYSFQPSVTSRKQFQARFSTSIGKYEFCKCVQYLKSVTESHFLGLNALLLVFQLLFALTFSRASGMDLGRHVERVLSPIISSFAGSWLHRICSCLVLPFFLSTFLPWDSSSSSTRSFMSGKKRASQWDLFMTPTQR